MSSDRIPGAPILGLSDLFEELIGAPASRPGAKPGTPQRPPAKRPVVVVRPGGGSSVKPGTKTIYGPAVAVKHNPTVQNHGRALKGAAVVARKVVDAANAALRAAKAKPAPPKIPPKAPPKRPTRVGGPPPPLSAKQKAAVAKHQAAVTKAKAAGQKAATAGVAAKKAAVNLADKFMKQKAAAVKLRKKPTSKARVGELITALGCYYDYVGAGPDPENPGFLTDGSTDPAAFIGNQAPVDPMMDPMMDPTMDPTMDLSDPSLDPLADPMLDPSGQDTGADLPPPPAMDQVIPDLIALGGILYDYSKGKKPGWIGSYSYFHQTIVNPKHADRRYGFVHGGDPHNPEWPGNKFDQWVWVHGKKGDSGSIPDFPGQEPGVSGWWDDAAQINRAYLTDANVAKASVAKGYGPIIGNPAWPDFAGLRMDQQGNVGWLPQEAPEWITFPLKQAAAITAQAAAKAAAEAAAAEAAAAAKAQADQAAAQAAQDAANALAESAEASAAAIADSQQATQQAAFDLEQQKADQAQAVMDAQAAAQERQAASQAAAQEQQFALEAARADLAAQREEQQILAEAARQELQMQQMRAQAAPPRRAPAEEEGYAEEEYAEEEAYEDEGFYEGEE